MKRYYGMFERIKENYPESLKECPLYYKEAADFYDQIAISYDDYPMFLNLALSFRGPILELCCGSGRITIPLLKAGFIITAVDLSDDMINNMKRKLENKKRYKKILSNLTLINEDMTKLNIKQKFNLIIIGATSIRLMDDDFSEFFNSMYELLNCGGCLFFNFEDIPLSKELKEVQTPMFTVDLEDDDKRLSLISMQRILNYEERRATVNFLKVLPSCNEKMLLSYTDYRIFGSEDIKEAVKKSKFKSCEIIPIENSNDYFCKMIKV